MLTLLLLLAAADPVGCTSLAAETPYSKPCWALARRWLGSDLAAERQAAAGYFEAHALVRVRETRFSLLIVSIPIKSREWRWLASSAADHARWTALLDDERDPIVVKAQLSHIAVRGNKDERLLFARKLFQLRERFATALDAGLRDVLLEVPSAELTAPERDWVWRRGELRERFAELRAALAKRKPTAAPSSDPVAIAAAVRSFIKQRPDCFGVASLAAPVGGDPERAVAYFSAIAGCTPGLWLTDGIGTALKAAPELMFAPQVAALFLAEPELSVCGLEVLPLRWLAAQPSVAQAQPIFALYQRPHPRRDDGRTECIGELAQAALPWFAEAFSTVSDSAERRALLALFERFAEALILRHNMHIGNDSARLLMALSFAGPDGADTTLAVGRLLKRGDRANLLVGDNLGKALEAALVAAGASDKQLAAAAKLFDPRQAAR